MKSKVFGFKIIFIMLTVLTAGLCFGIGVKPKTQKTVAVAQSTKTVLGFEQEEFSALFDGNVIFSAEKVYIGKEGSSFVGDKTFYQGKESVEQGRGVAEHAFKDIGENKTVVDNGEFIVFENIFENNSFVSGSGQNTQEALMISFGGYYFDQTTSSGQVVDINNVDVNNAVVLEHEHNIGNTTGTGALITWLKVDAYKNGYAIDASDLVLREYLCNGIAYYDFVYLVKQDRENANEGFYEFSFNYMVGGYKYQAEFEFYLINKASFTQKIDESVGYNAEPTVGWQDGTAVFKKCDNNESAAVYRMGIVPYESQTLSYPTITYDYTKYRLRYTHSLKSVNTKWEFDWRSKLGGSAEMVYSTTLHNATKAGTFDLVDYDSTNTINLVTIVLTEPGNYTIEYEPYYAGYNSDILKDSVDIGIEPGVLRLNIAGLVAQYSKANQKSARLEYYEIATAKANHVDLFIPNGYNVEEDLTVANQDVGFAYKLVESDAAREGVIVANLSSALINHQKDFNSINTTWKNLINDMSSKIDQASNDLSLEDDLGVPPSIFETVSYAETNQAAIWLSGNNATESESFYIYSSTKSYDSIAVDKFKVQTTFNKTGYYLVFVKVDVDNITSGSTQDYWQVFAFRYTSTSVNINVKAIINKTQDQTETQVIEGGAYTNKNVEISWKIPGVFDRDIKASYFISSGQTLTRDQLLKTPAQQFDNIIRDEVNGVFKAELGELVQEETFSQFLIRLTDEEKVATHKMFTIDRQSISNVKPYLVDELYFGSSVYYALATDAYGNNVWISNSITDSLATLMWDDKASGAPITATYTYYSFANNADVKMVDGSITTGWKLGSEATKTFTPVKEEDIINLNSSSVLSSQGVYLFRISDAAGNGCLFMFVIDKTENYFAVKLGEGEEKCYKNELIVYGNDVRYNLGKSKLIKLTNKTETVMEKLISDFVNDKAIDKLTSDEEFKYYQGNENNYETLKKLFKKVGGEGYLSIENRQVVAYNMNNKLDKDITLVSGRLTYNIEDGESYYKRILYAVSESHKFSTRGDKELSRVIIEINKDNSKLNVFFGNGLSTEDDNKRLDTGSDVNLGDFSGLKMAHASAMENIAISWETGTGRYEVESVTLTIYELDTKGYDKTRYFYGARTTKSILELAVSSNIDGRVIYCPGKDDCADGLYVVTRTYKGDGSNDFGEDVKEKNYYFIIDRKDIISKEDSVGGLIAIKLLEEETSFNTFETSGNTPIRFENKNVYSYLTTNKVPATLKVPAGKFDRYINAEDENISSSAGYNAGKLNVQISYMVDENYPQLIGSSQSDYRNGNVLIYDSEQYVDNLGDVKIVDGYIEINFEACIKSAYAKQRLVGDENDWMFLPGKYIIRIYDNVHKSNNGNTNEEYIGIVIEANNKGPQGEEYAKIDIQNGVDVKDSSSVKTITDDDRNKSENSNENGKFYTATVSQEYLEILIPKYDYEETDYPMLDPEYLEITQISDGKSDPEYFKKASAAGSDKIITNVADKYAYGVKLNTMLRDGNGNIIEENLSKELKYEIKIRYKINYGDETDRYKNCYVYYDTDDNLVRYYQATITIVIDRQAPIDNIQELNKRDAFVGEYLGEHKAAVADVETMTENNYIDYKSQVYFTHQYSAYYKNEKKDKGLIYPYQVDYKTLFNLSDVSAVYVKKIPDISTYNLSLPMVASSYHKVVLPTSQDNVDEFAFTKILTGEFGLVGEYYEIVEQDMAGNTTQYVVYYAKSQSESQPASINIPIECVTVETKESGSDKFNFTLSAEENVLHLYEITSLSEGAYHYDSNFIIELSKTSSNDPIYRKLTNPSTDFGALSSEIVDKINENGYGSYRLKIKARKPLDEEGVNSFEESYIINLYDKDNVKKITLEDLIENTNEGYKIFFNKAWVKDDGNGLVYYATKIEIISQDSLTTEEFIGYYDHDANILKFTKDGVEVSEYVFGNGDIVYEIKMEDVLKRSQQYRFSPSGKEFYKVEFENPNNVNADDWGDYYYIGDDGVYYGYTRARVFYDTGVFIGYLGNETYGSKDVLIDNITNENREFHITIKDKDDKLEKEYDICICSDLGNVTLREYSTSEVQNEVLKQYNNKKFNDSDVKGDKSLTGIMNLQWEILEHDSLVYQYILHEKLTTGEYRVGDDGSEGIKFTFEESQHTGNCTINTKSDSTGEYVFEIRVYGVNGKYLGNRIFAFEVRKANDKVYYVRDEVNNMAISNNSTFNLKELGIESSRIDGGGMKVDIEYPLYIASSELRIISVGSLVDVDTVFESVNYPGFTIYKISKQNSFSLFIAILYINGISENVNSVHISAPNVNEQVLTNTDYSITNSKDSAVLNDVTLTIDFETETDVLFKKNKLFLDVYYEKQLVASKELIDNDGDDSKTSFKYNELGNGKFAYVVRDLAGNRFTYMNGQDQINVDLLREVVVKLNGQVPLQNGYYNDSVQMEIFEKENYIPGSISVKVKFNGEEIAHSGSDYYFDNYGTYRIAISAKYLNHKNDEISLSKEVVFTILNKKEAARSVDLSCLGNCEIVKVLNGNNVDVTKEFMEMLNASDEGLNVTYELIMANSQALGVSAGKLTFDITYKIADGIYPERTHGLQICLNNEKPSIDCSLKSGEKSTKGFTITYNGAILYQQIGEAEIRINGKTVAVINEGSANTVSKIVKSFKASGAGDYYVQIVSSSGEVWESFKVTIKEPLNVWAIIVIIVVVLVVAAVVITIVVLRRKMRIR